MSKKYIYACIRLPMEVCPDGHYEPCNEYTEVHFEKCDKLPEKSSSGEYNLDAILSAFNQANEPLIISLTKDEIKQNTRHNSRFTNTFKNRRGNANRYSAKNRRAISINTQMPMREGCGEP